MSSESRIVPATSKKKPARRTYVSEIVGLISTEIRSGVWAPGQQIPSEKELVSRFRVGRSSVREAVQRLHSLGLVDVQHGRGVFVAEGPIPGSAPDTLSGLLKGEPLADLLDARKAIESRIAERAALHATDADIDRLGGMIEETVVVVNETNDGDYTRYLELNVEFHLLLAQISGSRLLARLLASLLGAHWDTAGSKREGTFLLHQNNEDHRTILEAIKARNGMAATLAMQNHLGRFEGRIPNALEVE